MACGVLPPIMLFKIWLLIELLAVPGAKLMADHVDI